MRSSFRVPIGLTLPVLLLLSQPLAGWEWPVSNAEVSATFGQDRDRMMVRGMEFRAGAEPVHPAEPGVVEFVGDGTGPEGGMGSFVAIRHEQGFLTVYGHLDPGIPVGRGDHVDQRTVIGTVGSSGAVTTRTLLFEVYDLESGLHVNPLLLMPDYPDTRRPTVDALYAVADGEYISMVDGGYVPPGRYDLLADLHDTWERGGDEVAPYSVVLFVNGRQRSRIVMERIVANDGVAHLASGTRTTSEEIYSEDGLIRLGAIELEGSDTRVELVVTDFAGNETELDLDIRGELPEDEDVQQEAGGR